MKVEIDPAMTEAEIKESVILAYKMVNTLHAKSFLKSLTKPWLGADTSPILSAIQGKALDDIDRKLKQFNKYNAFDLLYQYLDHLAEAKKIVIKKSEKKGILTGMSVEEYIVAANFVYKVSVSVQAYSEMTTAQFEAHLLLTELRMYLLLKDSVENGTGFKGLDKIFTTLSETKPVSFFNDGHPVDLLVIDRLAMHNNPSKILYIKTNRNFLSTRQVKDKNYIERDTNYFELHKVA
jgi:hypothetical protein